MGLDVEFVDTDKAVKVVLDDLDYGALFFVNDDYAEYSEDIDVFQKLDETDKNDKDELLCSSVNTGTIWRYNKMTPVTEVFGTLKVRPKE